MFDHLLPRTIDNTYRGQKVALWIFGLLVFLKLAMSVNSILNGDSVLTTADGIPLDTYPPAAARAIVSLFAMFALSQLMICLICILVLVRYRSAIPFMFSLLLVEHLSRKMIQQLMPIVRSGKSPGSAINLGLLILMVVGLTLSLWKRRSLQDAK